MIEAALLTEALSQHALAIKSVLGAGRQEIQESRVSRLSFLPRIPRE
jgi:hypothetical protein